MCGLSLFECVKCMEIVQENKGLDDYGFFVELYRAEIGGGLYYQ